MKKITSEQKKSRITITGISVEYREAEELQHSGTLCPLNVSGRLIHSNCNFSFVLRVVV
jgi:hypothetical protein